MEFNLQTNLQSRSDYFVEYPNFIENQLIRGYQTINEIVKNLSNYNDMMAKLEEYAKNDPNAYKMVISGLLYGILYDCTRSNEFFQYLFVLNKDNFEFFISTLISLIDLSHLKILNQTYDQIFLTFNKLIHMNCPKLIDLMIILLRVFFVGNWIHERIEFYKTFLTFLKSKLNWIICSPSNYLVGVTFIKVLRLSIENHFLATNPNENPIYREIIADELYILTKLWSGKKEGVLAIGKELIRNFISVSKANIPEIKSILEDISKLSSNDNNPIYVHLLNAQHPYVGFNPYVHIQIPPLMERMLIFTLTEVKKSNYIKYFSWMFKKFQIFAKEGEKSILVDITRYIITCFHSFSIGKKNDITPRWLVLGYLLKICKSDILSGEIKQAIFFDWIFFSKEKDSILLIEPGILVIFNSIREFTDITMELIEFLDIYSENFDLRQKNKIRNCVTEAFQQAEAFQIISSLKSLLKEEKVHEDIKKIFEVLIKYNKEEDSMIVDMKDNIMDITLPESKKLDITISSSGTSTKIIENEFFIHPALDELINPITVKNFLNFKSKTMFKSLLDEISKQYVNKLKSQNLLDSKLIKIQQSHLDIYSSFANFYLNTFKDELITNINPYESEAETENPNLKAKNVCTYIIDYLIIKYFERSEKEFNLILEFVKKINEKFPNFLIRLIYYFSKKSLLPIKSKFLTIKNYFTIFSKIFDDNVTMMKEKINLFFNTCIDYMDFEIINFFIENGFCIFNPLFFDELELIMILIIYSDHSSLNKIKLDISSNKYTLIEKNLYILINSSLNLEIFEQGKLWSLILAHNNLNTLTNIKEFLKNLSAFSKNISLKNKPYINVSNELFKNILNFIKIVFLNEINENNYIEYFSIFDFPCFYAESVYSILYVITNKLSQISNKNSASFFFGLIDEYLKQIDSYQDKFHFMENFLKLVKDLIIVDRNNNKSILFDLHLYSLKNLKLKLDGLLKSFRIELLD